ncbi:hypothetical protein [Streptomyces roseoviridis]|uniref:Uncharacterized protein n=1 Tax=Streptomyces roseoviridis TaxID=67361 RepID=A0ABV5QYR3_9ACTN
MKPRLTLEEHVEMGQALEMIRHELLKRSVKLANAYPKSGQPGIPAKKLEQALNAVDSARAELDNLMFQEHPHEGEVTVYYPHEEDRIRLR